MPESLCLNKKNDLDSQRLRTSLDNIRKYSYTKYSMSSYKSKTNYIKFN